MPYSRQYVIDSAKGKWQEILLRAGFDGQHLNGKSQPCPNCSSAGDQDRFQFTDYKNNSKGEGQIGWSYCRICGDGDGLVWVSKMTGLTGQELYKYVADVINLPELEPSYSGSVNNESLKSENIIPVPVEALNDIDKANKKIKFFNKKKETKHDNRFYSREYVYLYPYFNEQGQHIGMASRFLLKNGKKMTPMLFYQKFENGDCGWAEGKIEKDKPLFGLNSLKDDGPVFIVEGEKCQHALKKLIGANVITWTCGAKAWKTHNWKPLAERELIFIPDLDMREKVVRGKLGYECMFELAEYLKKPFKAIIFKNKNKIHGYDVANAIEEGMKKEQFEVLANRAEVYETKADIRLLESAGINLSNDEKQILLEENEINIDENPDENNVHMKNLYKPLGYDEDFYYFYSVLFRGIRTFRRNSFTDKSVLELNPSPNYWIGKYYTEHNHGRKLDTLKMNAMLIMESQKAGIFHISKVRRRGVYLDEDRVIVNLGDKILVDFEEKNPLEIKSKQTYVAGPAMDVDLDNVATNEDGEKLLEVLQQVNFSDRAEAFLFAGWLMLAPLGASLPYRPNLWINAGYKSGKSWLLNNILVPIIGDFSIKALGGTTEAGLRQDLKGDCLPILFDESEAKTDASKEKMTSILDLMRNYSYDSPFGVIKGSKDNKSTLFTLKSMFLFTSISLALQDQADKSRVTVLQLKPKPAHTEEQIKAKNEHFKNLKKSVAELQLDKNGKKFLAKSISQVKQIHYNTEIMADAIDLLTGDRRLGDQYGALLAGAFALWSDEILDPVSAKGWIEHIGLDLKRYENKVEDSDEVEILQTLLQHKIRVHIDNGPIEERSIGYLLSRLKDRSISLDKHKEISKVLTDIGIKYPKPRLEDIKGGKVYISVKSPYLRKVFRETAAQSNWHTYLKRLSFAEDTLSNSMHFGTSVGKHRAIILNDSFIQCED